MNKELGAYGPETRNAATAVLAAARNAAHRPRRVTSQDPFKRRLADRTVQFDSQQAKVTSGLAKKHTYVGGNLP